MGLWLERTPVLLGQWTSKTSLFGVQITLCCLASGWWEALGSEPGAVSQLSRPAAAWCDSRAFSLAPAQLQVPLWDLAGGPAPVRSASFPRFGLLLLTLASRPPAAQTPHRARPRVRPDTFPGPARFSPGAAPGSRSRPCPLAAPPSGAEPAGTFWQLQRGSRTVGSIADNRAETGRPSGPGGREGRGRLLGGHPGLRWGLRFAGLEQSVLDRRFETTLRLLLGLDRSV